MDGVNDANTHLGDATWNAVYQECMIAALAHLGAPSTTRLAGQSASVTKTGTWTADNTIGVGYGIQSSTTGDTLSFSISITAPATGLYLSSRITDGSTATASVSIDGTVVGTLYGSAGATGGVTMATPNGTTTAVGGVRFPITSGTHSVLITNTSPAGQSFTFQEASWFSKPQSPGPPRVLVGGVTHINTISADPYTAVYDGFIRAITTQFWNDGFYTQYVDTRAYLNTSTDYTNGDPLHPNDIGHMHLRDAFLGAAGGYGAFAPLNQTWTTTTATAETVVIRGVSSTSVCVPSPGNASAATGGAWISPIATAGQITLNHAATAGMVYNISCTP